MRHLVILGGGTAGTMIANKLRHRLDRTEWHITVVDRDDEHHYQPGYLFLPFGGVHPRAGASGRGTRFLADGVDFVVGEVDRVDAGRRTSSLLDGRPSAALRLAGHRHRHHPAPGPDARACSARSGGAASSTSTPSRAPRRSREALAALRRRPAGRAHHRDADQVPGGAAGVHLPRRGLAARARASATGSSWST